VTRAQRLAVGVYVSRWMPRGRALDARAIRSSIPCCGPEHGQGYGCTLPATHVEYVPSSSPFGSARAASYLYYCLLCWIAPGPSGRSARDRALEGPAL
jgi:hypothetical protein